MTIKVQFTVNELWALDACLGTNAGPWADEQTNVDLIHAIVSATAKIERARTGEPPPDPLPFPLPCGHDRLQLVEGGYTRTWSLSPDNDGVIWADFTGLEDFSDTGDEIYWVECATCLQRYQTPDEWEWN
jgi:hypothetical protein